MKTFWHVTPASNVRIILKEGLKPQYFKGSARYETGKYALFLWDEKDEALSFLSDLLQEENIPVDKPYAILKIRLPYDIPLKLDEFDFNYTNAHIPPKFIKVVKIAPLKDLAGF